MDDFTSGLVGFIRTSLNQEPTRFEVLHDVLGELEQIVYEDNHPDAVEHAKAAIRRMSLLWLTVDELDERYLRG